MSYENSSDYYQSTIGYVRSVISRKADLEKRFRKLEDQLLAEQTDYVRMLNAQKLLSTLADDNTNEVLGYVTSIINKGLMEIFPKEGFKVALKPTLFAQSKPHIELEIVDGTGYKLDIATQNGDGIKQIISFLYVVCLIEIRKGRRLVILDERLNGLHLEAKKCIEKMMEIFAKGGFQFVMVEYGSHLGKIYNVERRNYTSVILPVNGKYEDTMISIADVDLDAMEDEEEQ